jgi:CO/xanthine dehydrogenase Mo-binding subunit
MNFVIESMMEIASQKLGMNSIEFREKNMVRQGSITITGQKLDNHKVAMEEVLNVVLKESGYFEKSKNNSFGNSENEEQYGIGLAMSYRGMSLGAEGVDYCAAIINVQNDGSILLETGIHENGQGSESAMSLILAEELGVNLNRIRYRRPSTSNIPDSRTTVASRGTVMGGGAVVNATKELKKIIFSYASEKYSYSADEFEIKNDNLVNKNSSISIPFNELITDMFHNRVYPFAFGVFRAPKVTWDEETGQGDAYFSFTYGCQVVELNVNKKTGRIKLLNAIAAHDTGKAINKSMTEGQFYGGIAMGTGYALHEELKMKDGKITSLNFNSYRIPRATDMPEIKAILVENPDPNSPSGAKGIGEPTNELMAPAIANAIFNATGKRFFKLPIKISPNK